MCFEMCAEIVIDNGKACASASQVQDSAMGNRLIDDSLTYTIALDVGRVFPLKGSVPVGAGPMLDRHRYPFSLRPASQIDLRR